MSRPDRTPFLLIFALYAAGLLAAGQFAKVSLTLGPLAEAYPQAPVAFVVSGVAVMGIVFGAMAGGITASIGPRRAILAALAISAVAGGVQAFLPAFPLMMALRVVEGAGHLLLVVAIPTLMAALAAERHRALVLGVWATFFGMGFSIYALAIGEAGVAPVYAAHAGVAAALGLVLWVMLPRGVATGRRTLPRLSDHFTIYTTPRLFAPGLGHGIYALLFLALVTYLPTALGAPWLAPVLPVVGLLGSLLTGALARRIVPGRLVWCGFLAMVALFALTWAAGPLAPYVAIVAMAVSGIVAGAGFAAVPWLNANNADRALANGALAQLGNVGTFSGTPVLAALGVGAAIPMAVVLGLAGAGATALAYRAATRGQTVPGVMSASGSPEDPAASDGARPT
ncbi:MFS transporter [Roseibacterium sp. SDUM158017]|uniref:MFS transporter n=1 Tax=Roseicyclus salinarum TaxID=3036773 RepID=UPI0024150ABE|nr:MFS transporter [Roseibacterium sp. SDUM158017]MDG4649184.1 MFS transporter [Roseibacterium sp. SDUM158017]